MMRTTWRPLCVRPRRRCPVATPPMSTASPASCIEVPGRLAPYIPRRARQRRLRAESAVNTRSDAAPAHVAHGGVEPRAGVIVERFDANAPQRLQVRRYKDNDDQTDSDRQKGKRRLKFRPQHWSEELTLTVRGGGILPHIRPGRHPLLDSLALASLAF